MNGTATSQSPLSAPEARGAAVNRPEGEDLLDSVGDILRGKCNPPFSIRGFLARGDITETLTDKVIWDILNQNKNLTLREEELDKIVSQILNKDSKKRMIKIFAVLIFTGKVEYILDFIRKGINDEHLPLVSKDYQHLDFWRKSQVDDFCSRQWLVHIPVFNLAPDHTGIEEYAEEERMPFLYERKIPNGRGGHGEVSEVEIHHDHVDGDSSNSTFALKRIYSRSKWEDELNALNRFRGKSSGHRHLIKLLFAYEHKDKGFYMVFPLARGDLNYYWENNSSHAPSLEAVRWLVKQCEGITGALRKIHRQDSFPDQNRGRHGDIKPSNILWFEDAKEPRGRLVIADLTMARFHSVNTIDNTSARDRDFSMTYRPPETEFNHRTSASQAYDVWSLGCVFFEFVVWYLVGYSAIHNMEGSFNGQQKCTSFRVARFNDDNSRSWQRDDKFFNITNNESGDGCTAEVKKSVHMWAGFLRASTRCSDAIRGFLDLIMKRMLVIEPHERISMEQVNIELISISSKCLINEKYCCLGNSGTKSAIDIQLSASTQSSCAEYSVTSSLSSLSYSDGDYESSSNSTIPSQLSTASRIVNTIDNTPRINRIQMHIERMANSLPPHSQCDGQGADQSEGGQHSGTSVSPYLIKPTCVARNRNAAECTSRESLERPVRTPSHPPLNTMDSTGHSVGGQKKYPLGWEHLGDPDKNPIPSNNVFNTIEGNGQPGNIKAYGPHAFAIATAMAALQTSPIAQLVPDILLEIFNQLALESNKSNAPLISSVLCCQKWRLLASSVLYRHVVLDEDRLEGFTNNRMSCEVTSLTVTMDALGVDPIDPSIAIRKANARNSNLRKLCSLIGDIKPATISISIDMPFPYAATSEVASIVNSLPESCTGLEIDVRHSSSFNPNLAPAAIPEIPQAHPHLCDSIRAVLRRLKHLRLRLPTLCPAIFSANPPGQDLRRRAIHAPLLKTCLINLSLRQPGPPNQGAWAIECGHDYAQTPHIGQQDQLPSALPPLEGVLTEFAHLNSSNLERLWIIDVKPVNHGDLKDHAAWIRRDFMSNTSYPIPVWNIGFFGQGGCVARVPSPTKPRETEDWVSTIESVETIAEGGTWAETATSARFPTLDIQRYKPPHWILSGSEYRKTNRQSCMIWRNEGVTGGMTLPGGPGELMQEWDLHEITPSGWTRDNFPGSPMVRA
ncbi:hypothetical protein NUW58_g2896 [Xylaria curta]|uniref:Uncharacterized protein n=1 Tax=Xylaria curta TaxID=42375 RepID=A0ACC1PED3_9PEZI|nr:hypothetical protein NUW58_g2896 [Xylaria curta]